jgi:hypothetical protein
MSCHGMFHTLHSANLCSVRFKQDFVPVPWRIISLSHPLAIVSQDKKKLGKQIHATIRSTRLTYPRVCSYNFMIS